MEKPLRGGEILPSAPTPGSRGTHRPWPEGPRELGMRQEPTLGFLGAGTGSSSHGGDAKVVVVLF